MNPSRSLVALACLLQLGISPAVPAAEPVRLYLANDDHTDYLWTADAATTYPASLGTLRADIVIGSFGASTLAQGDFEAAATATDVIPLFPVPTADGEETIGLLSAAGHQAINRDGLTQFRVYFSNGDNNDNAADLLGCYSGKDPTVTNRPLLRVQYHQL